MRARSGINHLLKQTSTALKGGLTSAWLKDKTVWLVCQPLLELVAHQLVRLAHVPELLFPANKKVLRIRIRHEKFSDPGSGIREGKNSDPGYGINIPDPQHWKKITKH